MARGAVEIFICRDPWLVFDAHATPNWRNIAFEHVPRCLVAPHHRYWYVHSKTGPSTRVLVQMPR